MRWISFLGVLLGAPRVFAADLPHDGTFAYSSLCWERESGDASGFRILLTRSAAGDSLRFEWTDGPLEGPVQAQHLVIGPHGTLSFAVPLAGGGAPALYEGRVSREAVILDPLPYGGGAVVRRVRSAGKKMHHCRD